jgi:hypothetical protein
MSQIKLVSVLLVCFALTSCERTQKSTSFESTERVEAPTTTGFVAEENDGKITITGYNGTENVVIIPSTVNDMPIVAIGESAFEHKELKRVTIPDSIITIGKDAFRTNQLTSITIPNSVISIGSGAFQNNQLTRVIISNSLTSIEMDTFYFNQITSVTIPDSVISIGSRAFGTNQLTNATISNSVTSIEKEAFSGNKLTNITIPNSVTSIGREAFYFNQITNVTIPNNVTFIGERAFSAVLSFDDPLSSITIGANVKVERTSGYGNDRFVIFSRIYNDNGNQAGTYTWSGNTWSRGAFTF